MPPMQDSQSRSSGTVYVITPWRKTNDLLRVRRELYGLDADLDQRQHGADTVAAWSMRGNVPHAIQSTAQLMAARLHHETESSTPFSIQATYTTAFCRFITGYCDIYMIGTMRKSMHQVAEQLDMPASWIDLRHEATHGKLPSLKRLEITIKQALAWLWQNYWAQLENTEDVELLRDGAVPLVKPAEFRPLLTQFLKNRVEEVKRRASATAPDSASARMCIELIQTCKGDEKCLRNLVWMLVQPKLLVPANRDSGDDLQGAFMLWTPLLRALTRYQTRFLALFLTRLTVILTEPAHLHPPPDAFREAVFEWVVYASKNLYGRSDIFNDEEHDDLKMLVMEECVLSPLTPWTEKLANVILQTTEDQDFRERWEPYCTDPVARFEE